MLYILSGPDDFTIARSLHEIKKQIGDEASLAMSTTTLDGKQVTPEQLKTVCETLPFMTAKRLVIVEGLLARFEPRRQPRTQTARTAKQTTLPEWKDPEKQKRFIVSMSSMPESTILVLVDGEIKSANPILKGLAGKGTAKSFPFIKGASLTQWVQKRVDAERGSIAPRALALLARLVGGNLWTMAGEIDKLVLFASGRRIEEEDVKTMVGYAQQTTVFIMIDAVLDFKAEPAEQSLQKLLQDGTAPAQLLALLARQVQLIVRARELRSHRKSSTEIQQILGVPEWVLRKTLEQAGRHSLPRLRDVYHYLLNTDLAIKTGQYDAELAMTILVAELSQRATRRIPHTVS